MIWRLEYENAHGDVARLDIQRGLGSNTTVEIVEGTGTPFLLSYELEGDGKSGYIMSSFADISIYETSTFNIDELKTSDETAISVNWYVNSILTWSGFIVPDFFYRDIGSPAIVNMTASDRISSLKDKTLSDVQNTETLSSILEKCLAKTGLSLPIHKNADFTCDATNVFDTYVSKERLIDDKGKKLSCFDILRSILVLSNSTIRQRNGRWDVLNKIYHEGLTPDEYFDEIRVGGKRTIQPVASSVGVFQEFGGIRTFPENYDFGNGKIGWTNYGDGPVWHFETTTKEVSFDHTEFPDFTPIIKLGGETNIPKLIIRAFEGRTSFISDPINVPRGSNISFSFVISARGNSDAYTQFDVFKYYDGVKDGVLLSDGSWENSGSNKIWLNFWEYSDNPTDLEANIDVVKNIKGKIPVEDGQDVSKITLRVVIYDAWSATFQGSNAEYALHSIKINFDPFSDAKGLIYKTEQLAEFSKKQDPETTIFGDFLTEGLNGYFYPYSKYETSILSRKVGAEYLPTKKWASTADPESGELPLLQHVSRQMSRASGVARDRLSIALDLRHFNPLANFENCKGEKFTIVQAKYDFLRSVAELELEQIAYGTMDRRDFIYSYFGGKDDGVTSLGGISEGGGQSFSGGSFLDKFFTYDAENDALIANVNLVSEKELAAYFGGGDLPSMWDDLPVATATTLGGVKVSPGSGLVMNGEQLEIDGDNFNLANYYTKTNIDAFFAGTTAKTGYNKSNWDTAHTDRLKWDGGSTGLNATTGRTSLGLGTAATRDAQTSLTDATTGRLMEVGAFGLGGIPITLTGSEWDVTSRPNQFVRAINSSNSIFNRVGVGLNLNYSSTYAAQLFMSVTGTLSIKARATSSSGVWGNVEELYHTGNLVNPVTGTGTAGQISYWNGTGSQTGSANLVWDNASGILSSSKVAIGKTTVTSGYRLDVNGSIRAAGNIYATGEVTAYTASDKRLKTNINKFGNALSIIDKLTPVTYNWNAKAVELNGNKDMTGVNYGLIAQELEQIAPDLIRPIYGDYKTYDDRGLMTIMLQAIKELKSKVDKLENKN